MGQVLSTAAMLSEKLQAKPVVVHWEDAAHQFGWLEGEVVERLNTIVETVGWLIHMDENCLIIVQSLTEGAHAQTLQIPAGMVREVKYLRYE